MVYSQVPERHNIVNERCHASVRGFHCPFPVLLWVAGQLFQSLNLAVCETKVKLGLGRQAGLAMKLTAFKNNRLGLLVAQPIFHLSKWSTIWEKNVASHWASVPFQRSLPSNEPMNCWEILFRTRSQLWLFPYKDQSYLTHLMSFLAQQWHLVQLEREAQSNTSRGNKA